MSADKKQLYIVDDDESVGGSLNGREWIEHLWETNFMYTWEEGILECIRSYNKEVVLQDIYVRIGRFVKLGPEHFKITKWGQPAYQREVRTFVSILCKKELLIWVSRGCYRINEII